VVSSDRSFNHDVLDDSCAILIDPNSEEELEAAIRTLKEDPALRRRLAQGSEARGAQLTIEKRVDKILAFLKERKDAFLK
jgi:glycosyltransferase involved in cell wall biosynthesis